MAGERAFCISPQRKTEPEDIEYGTQEGHRAN